MCDSVLFFCDCHNLCLSATCSVLHCKVDVMEKKHKDLLKSKHVYLVDKLDMPLLFDGLRETDLLSGDDVERLEVN